MSARERLLRLRWLAGAGMQTASMLKGEEVLKKVVSVRKAVIGS